MNDWPPPSIDDAPSVAPTAASASVWWRHPMAQALLIAWVVAGVIALVAVGFIRAVEPESAMRPALTPVSSTSSDADPSSSGPTVTSADDTAARTDSGPTSAVPSTTEPLVRSAPPVPPATNSGASDTTLVVTLPPTISVTPPPTPPPTGPPEIVVEINFDAEGDDAADPNGEWVRFTNVGTQPVDMTNWIVRDDGLQNAHVFATLTLEPGASVTLFSGCGEPTDTERFFCAGEVWNNDGDVVSLFDDAGVLVVQLRG